MKEKKKKTGKIIAIAIISLLIITSVYVLFKLKTNSYEKAVETVKEKEVTYSVSKDRGGTNLKLDVYTGEDEKEVKQVNIEANIYKGFINESQQAIVEEASKLFDGVSVEFVEKDDVTEVHAFVDKEKLNEKMIDKVAELKIMGQDKIDLLHELYNASAEEAYNILIEHGCIDDSLVVDSEK